MKYTIALLSIFASMALASPIAHHTTVQGDDGTKTTVTTDEQQQKKPNGLLDCFRCIKKRVSGDEINALTCEVGCVGIWGLQSLAGKKSN